jgi:uncharacterized protein (PEP-CTERM system associated)
MNLTMKPRPIPPTWQAGERRRDVLLLTTALVLAVAVLRPVAAFADPDPAAGQSFAPPTLPAPTDTVLPRIGVDPGVPDEADHMLDSFGEQTARPGVAGPPPGWSFSPVLAVSEEYTTNAGAVAGIGINGGGSDWVTLIQPSIAIDDNSRLLMLHADYRPTGVIFANNSGFSQFEEAGDASMVFTAVPDWLYLDARGSIGEQAVFGGLGPSSAISLGRDNLETISSVAVSPYVAHEFGGTGMFKAGYSFEYTSVDAPGNLDQQVQSPYPFLLPSQYGSSWLETNRVFASFTTGPDFGRFRNKIAVDADFYDGSGALRDAHRVLATDDASYALTRLVRLVGQIGYEDTNYPAVGFSYTGPIGAAGITLTPDQYSSLTMEYRYVDGYGAPYVQGSWQVTPRLRVFGGYSEGISSFAQDIQNTLLYGGTDATGATASTQLAAPLIDTTNAVAANEALSLERRLSASAAWFGDRDTITLSGQYERNTQVGNPFALYPAYERAGFNTSGIGNFTTRGWSVYSSWQHSILEDLTSYVYVAYGNATTALLAESPGDSVSVEVQLQKSFAHGLSAYIRYGGTYFTSGNNSGPYGDDSTFTIGVVKHF